MMFSNPPLVELIAELRWVPGGVSLAAPPLQLGGANQPPQVVSMQFPIQAPHWEQTFSRFSSEVSGKGFGNSERLIPIGFLTPPFNVVYRFRKSHSIHENFLYQLGPGIFTANALPPYRDWTSFRPIVREGIQALLASRDPSENGSFSQVILRYIDLFSEEFTEGRTSLRFFSDVLGLQIDLPASLTNQVSEMSAVRSGLQLSMPLRNGLTMNLALNEGIAAGKSGILMSTEVTTIQPIVPEMDYVMNTLENAHSSVRATFLGLTGKLDAKMGRVRPDNVE